MGEYVFYMRTDEGHLERLGNMIVIGHNSLLGSYEYEEALVNFPEFTVFWANEQGSSVGIAPIIPDQPK